MDRNCNFKGINGSGECHKSWLTWHTALENVCDLEQELQQTFLRRAGIGEDIANNQELLICAHHKEAFGSALEKKFPKCCNIYVSQGVTVEEFIEILLEALNILTGHSFIAKSQAKYLKEKR